MVTSVCWNTVHRDMFAVSFGSYDFTRQSTGMVCVYSLKNPSYPDYVYLTESGVMCLDFNATVAPSMLACGLYDGSVVVFDLGKRDPKYGTYSRDPVIVSSLETGQHMDPVWQVGWSTTEESSGVVSFRSLGSDGRLLKWSITTNELQVEEMMKFQLGIKDDAYEIDESEVVGLASTTCLDFAPGASGDEFVVGTEEGDIYKCSTAYTTEYLMTYDGHDLIVYTVDFNKFHETAFLSCSADWTVQLWDKNMPASLCTWDLNNAVCDVAWAPFSSTVFAAVTADSKVHVFDLDINRLEPICEQKVVKKAKLTRIIFNPVEPIIMVGDDKGSVIALKLSPNLRQLTEVDSHRDPKTGNMKSPPEPEGGPECPLVKWQKEELDAEVGKLQNVMDRAIQTKTSSL